MVYLYTVLIIFWIVSFVASRARVATTVRRILIIQNVRMKCRRVKSVTNITLSAYSGYRELLSGQFQMLPNGTDYSSRRTATLSVDFLDSFLLSDDQLIKFFISKLYHTSTHSYYATDNMYEHRGINAPSMNHASKF